MVDPLAVHAQWAHGPSLDDETIRAESDAQRRSLAARAAASTRRAEALVAAANVDGPELDAHTSLERLLEPSDISSTRPFDDPVQMARMWAVSLGGGGLESALVPDCGSDDPLFVNAAHSPALSPAVSRMSSSSADGASAAPTAQPSPTAPLNSRSPGYLSGGAGAGGRGAMCKTRVGADEPTWGMNEAVERMKGFQERYTNNIRTAAGSGQLATVLEVTEGTEHLEMFKSHGSAHGADHVKFVGTNACAGCRAWRVAGSGNGGGIGMGVGCSG